MRRLIKNVIKSIAVPVSIFLLTACSGNKPAQNQQESNGEADSAMLVPQDTMLPDTGGIDTSNTDLTNEENEMSSQALYQMKEILANTRNNLKNLGFKDDLNRLVKNTSYITTDYDNDGIPELWIIYPGGDMFELDQVEVYKMTKDGNVKLISTKSGGCLFKKNGKIHALISSGDGDWSVIMYNIKGDKLIESMVDRGEDYDEAENYKPMPNVKFLRGTSVNDPSTLEKAFK